MLYALKRNARTTEAGLGRLLVTGVSRGIGAATARLAAQRGFAVCISYLQRLRHGGSGGSIVNVSSGAARHGSPGEYIDYAASKAAVDTLTIGLAREVAEEGIRVNAVRPGLIHTEIHEKSGEPGRVERLAATIPMKRGGRPDEVAAAILWLLSAEASYITGAILDVAGGR